MANYEYWDVLKGEWLPLDGKIIGPTMKTAAKDMKMTTIKFKDRIAVVYIREVNNDK
jgi:hypothetical protein